MSTIKKIVKSYPTKEKISYCFDNKNKDLRKRKSCVVLRDEESENFISVDRKNGEIVRYINFDEYEETKKKNYTLVKTKICDYVDCNDFEMFGTLTFDDKYENEDRLKKFTQWANDLGKKYPDFKYICVKELHLSGKWHFHILLKGLPLCDAFDYSGKVTCKALKKKCCAEERYTTLGVRKGKTDGLKIYNLKSWGRGFSNFTFIVDMEATRHYIAKYITKDMLSFSEKNKKKYYCSKGLNLPKIRRIVYPNQVTNNLFKFAWCDIKRNGMHGLFLKKEYESKEANVIMFSYDFTGETLTGRLAQQFRFGEENLYKLGGFKKRFTYCDGDFFDFIGKYVL